MASTIRQPFGTDLDSEFYGGLTTLKKVAAASTAVERTIDANMSFLRIATATKGKTLKFFADAELPAGAVVMISASSASSEILLSSGFTGQTFINAATAAHGTGSYAFTVIYDGTYFRPVSKPSKLNTRDTN